jgi:hypothetical protein
MAYKYWNALWEDKWNPYLSCTISDGIKCSYIKWIMHPIYTNKGIAWLMYNKNISEMHKKYPHKIVLNSFIYSTGLVLPLCENPQQYYPWNCKYSHNVKCKPFLLDYQIFMDNMISTTLIVFMHELLQTQHFTVPTLFECIFFDDYLTKMVGKY